MFIDTNVLVRARFTAAPAHGCGMLRKHRAPPDQPVGHVRQSRYRHAFPSLSSHLPIPVALRDLAWFESTFDILEDDANVTCRLTELCREVPVVGRQIH